MSRIAGVVQAEAATAELREQLRVRDHDRRAPGRVRRLRLARNVDGLLDDQGHAIVGRVEAARVDGERRGMAGVPHDMTVRRVDALRGVLRARLLLPARGLRRAAHHPWCRIAAGGGGVDLPHLAPALPAECERAQERRSVRGVVDDGICTLDEPAVPLRLARPVEAGAWTLARDRAAHGGDRLGVAQRGGTGATGVRGSVERPRESHDEENGHHGESRGRHRRPRNTGRGDGSS